MHEEVEYTQSFDVKIWKKIWPFMMADKRRLITLVALNIIVAIIDIMFPLFQRYAIDEFIQGNTTQGMTRFAICYIIAIAAQAALVVWFCRTSMTVEMHLNRDLKKACFTHLQNLSFSYYNTTPVGYAMARVMNDTNKIGSMIGWGLADAIWQVSYVIFVFISMLFLNWKLALVIMLIVPAMALLTVYFQNRILKWNRETRRINSLITSGYNEGIMGAKTSKTLVLEEKNTKEFEKITTEMRIAGVRAARLSAVYLPLVLFCGAMATAIVLVRGGQMVIDNLLMIGTLSAFCSYAVGIFEPIQSLAGNLSELIATQANIERVATLLEQEVTLSDTPEVIEKYGDSVNPKRENWEAIKGDIEFKNVSFTYPDGDEEVLHEFNLKINAGTTVAIVGETGAGKSTLVNLACRFFEPTSGEILIDGRNYKERSMLWLHSNIGYVLQNPHLFSGTIMENIRYGRLDATDEEVMEAAKAVSADQVVAKFKNGYASDVGEGGDMLSTGEKQLISFARAILANPAIFVLDEATSSIDTKTERLIQEATDKLLKDRTSFVIAHRLSTIRQADIILVVNDGRIVESGTHKELLAMGGAYSKLYWKQWEVEKDMI